MAERHTTDPQPAGSENSYPFAPARHCYAEAVEPVSRHIQPRYFDAFRCAGADCPDTCCSGWRLPVDRETYQKYACCEDPSMGPLLRSLVTIQPSNNGPHHYAEFHLLQASCAFLSEGWCSIQSKLGESYLANACATFPRSINLVDGVLERSLDLSCPESARLALSDPGPLEFVEGAGSRMLAGTPGAINGASLGNLHQPGSHHVAEVRRLVIRLLQNRGYPLSQRLILVGHVCDRLQRIADNGDLDCCPDLVRGFETAVGLGLFDDHLNGIAARPSTQLGITVQLIAERLKSDFVAPRFLALFDGFKQGLGWTVDSTFDEMSHRYAEVHAEHYVPFIGQHEYMLEHYLVTYAFRNLFPYGTVSSVQGLGDIQPPIYAQYSLMMAHFAMLRTILIGLAGLHRSAFSPMHIVHAVQLSTKTFEHAVPFQARVLQMLSAWGLKTPASMTVLAGN